MSMDDDFDDDDDYPDPSDDEFNEFEDEQTALRGTSQCDGLCIPQCSWCLVSHVCPDECKGSVCPYEALAKKRPRPLPVDTTDTSDDIEF